jgi:hypothetical protein
VGALAAGLFVYGFGEELWFRFLPAYLRTLGASAFLIGAFGTAKEGLPGRLGALWTVRPSLTFVVAAALGGLGTLWAALTLPSHPPIREKEAAP